MASFKKRSPLKAAPLRTAGQSIEEEILRIKMEDFVAYISLVVFMAIFTLFEWYRWVREIPPKPIPISIGAVILTVYCVYKILSVKKKLRNLQMARDGEKAVGEFLDRFREKGYRVFHDIVGGNFNIDHLLIGKTGIYTIETKTVSKPITGQHEIDYDGKQIMVYGHKPFRDPIVQAKAQANWVKDLVRDLTGKEYSVQPVVLYPGWYVRQPAGAEVWVLNPKALTGFFDKRDNLIDESIIPSISTHLSRYVRNT